MVGRSLIRISYFLVLFYLFTNVDRILFSPAQQKYTRRQFPSSEAHQPLCLHLRTSINIPSQGSETASFTLHYHTANVPPHLPLHLAVKALHSANTEQTIWGSRPALLLSRSYTLLTPPNQSSARCDAFYYFKHFIHK